jgi:hypothetical protein
MIFPGLVLLAAGYFTHQPIVWVLGGLITAAAALQAFGAFKTSTPELEECEKCHGRGTYRHYFQDKAETETEDDSITATPDSDDFDDSGKWEWRICPCSMPAERSRW